MSYYSYELFIKKLFIWIAFEDILKILGYIYLGGFMGSLIIFFKVLGIFQLFWRCTVYIGHFNSIFFYHFRDLHSILVIL